jgi:phage tail-like protein
LKAEAIRYLLPGVFQRTLHPGRPLAALLEVMEAMHAPAEDALEHFDAILDPWRTPDAFVPMLARWVDLQRIFERPLQGKDPMLDQLMPTGLGRLRALIEAAAYLSQWRGTRKGLLLFLQIATGFAGYEIDEQVPGGLDLHLMSSVKDARDIPRVGEDQIIVAAVNQVLHFRIFDGDGRMVVDTDEDRLREEARPIEDLRKQLVNLWPPHEPTGSEKGQVIDAVTSIVGHALPGQDGKPRPFHLRVRAPAAAESQRDLIERIIASERPASVTHELEFRSS